MKIATFNVNGINGRLPRLLEWLAETPPDVACLQELKTSDATFPARRSSDAGYGAVWHGQKGFNGVAILAQGAQPVERRRGLPGDPDDTHSRYLEAAVDGIVVASIYLPNGNPQPGPKFDYKLAWFERLIEHAAQLCDMRAAGGAGRRLQRRPHRRRRRHLLRRIVEERRAAAARKPRGLPAAARAGLDRRDPRAASERADVHLLGLLPPPLAAQCRAAHRPPAAERDGGGALQDAGVDRAVRGREKPSDHAPAWVRLG